MIIRDSAPILATVIVGPEAATYWYVGNRLCAAFGGLIYNTGYVFVPLSSSLYVSEKWEQLKSALVRGTRLCALLGFTSSVVLIMFGRDLITFWMGPGFELSYYVLVITALGWLASWVFCAAEALLIGTRKLWVVTIMQFFRLIASILMAITMANIWDIIGLTAGFVIPVAIISGFFVPYFVSKACKIKTGQLLRRALPAPLIVSLVITLSIMAIKKVFPPVNLQVFVGQVLIITIIFGILSLLIGLDTASRDFVLSKIGLKRNDNREVL